MFPEILTPQEHRTRKYQQPDRMTLRDGRTITIFPNGDTETILIDGTVLSTTKYDKGTWVKKVNGDTEYIPPLDQFTKEFLDEKIKARDKMRDAKLRHKDNKNQPFWDIELHEQIMDRGTYS